MSAALKCWLALVWSLVRLAMMETEVACGPTSQRHLSLVQHRVSLRATARFEQLEAEVATPEGKAKPTDEKPDTQKHKDAALLEEEAQVSDEVPAAKKTKEPVPVEDARPAKEVSADVASEASTPEDRKTTKTTDQEAKLGDDAPATEEAKEAAPAEDVKLADKTRVEQAEEAAPEEDAEPAQDASSTDANDAGPEEQDKVTKEAPAEEASEEVRADDMAGTEETADTQNATSASPSEEELKRAEEGPEDEKIKEPAPTEDAKPAKEVSADSMNEATTAEDTKTTDQEAKHGDDTPATEEAKEAVPAEDVKAEATAETQNAKGASPPQEESKREKEVPEGEKAQKPAPAEDAESSQESSSTGAKDAGTEEQENLAKEAPVEEASEEVRADDTAPIDELAGNQQVKLSDEALSVEKAGEADAANDTKQTQEAAEAQGAMEALPAEEAKPKEETAGTQSAKDGATPEEDENARRAEEAPEAEMAKENAPAEDAKVSEESFAEKADEQAQAGDMKSREEAPDTKEANSADPTELKHTEEAPATEAKVTVTPENVKVTEERAAASRDQKAASNETDQHTQSNNCSLLLFVAAGDFGRGGELIKGNLEHLHSSLSGRCAPSVYLNHYNGERDSWRDRSEQWEPGWYDKYVQYSAAMPGFKFQVMQELLSQVGLETFTWVWAVDEDFNILDTDVARLLELADQSGALISLPAFTQAGDDTKSQELSYPMQAPDAGCLYRYANVLEVIFPLFRTEALQQLLWGCEKCIGERVVWGLDRMWCGYTARVLAHDRDKACAIIDGTPMVHQNFKTLKHKYEPNEGSNGELYLMRRMETSWEAEARAWMEQVREAHAEDFVSGNSKIMEAGECVPASGMAREP